MASSARTKYWALAILALALLTNRWMGWQEGIQYLTAVDVEDGYLPVAAAAPGLPSELIPFHKAQRFFVPYVVGSIAKGSGAPIPSVFFAGTALATGALLAIFWWLLGALQLPPRRRLLAFALFVFQPYALRYYGIVPGMFSDLTFELGTGILLAGLFFRKSSLPWIGLALAALSRQTALLLLPGVVLWIWFGWKEKPARSRALWATGLSLWTLFFYEATGLLAARIGSANVNAEHLTALFTWILSPDFSFPKMAEHTLRCTLPLLPAAILLLREPWKQWPRESLFLLLMALVVAAQPFLAGPTVTGQNAARLITLGLLPLVVAWAIAAREKEWPLIPACAMALLLFAGSFHHLYTVIGPHGPMGSAALQLVVMVLAPACARWAACTARH